MSYLLAFDVTLTLYFGSVFPSRPENMFKCEKEEDPLYVPYIARCDFRNDCKDGSDEKNCTRHPGVGQPRPSEIADSWTQESIWSLNGSRATLLSGYHKMYPGSGTGSFLVTCKRILNKTTFDIESKYKVLLPKTDPCKSTHSNAYLLSSELHEPYTWAKSTSGHVQEGAVIAGLSPDFELTFLCRIPQVYFGREVTLEPSVGTVRPSTGTCSLLKMELRDYEVLVRPQEFAGFSCGADTFNCTDSKQCIPSYFVCDGESDCKDASDENISMCREVKSCGEHEFPCSDGKCIGMEKLCEVRGNFSESKKNCYDGKDESKETLEQFCRDKFWCDSARILNTYDRCDSKDNCLDGSDEYNCSSYPALRPAFPHQLEFQDWKKGFWVPSEASIQEYFHIASTTVKTLFRNNTDDYRLEKIYYRRAQHSYGVFNTRCLESRDICNHFFTENGTTVKAKDTHFETLQHSPKENNYEWVRSAKGHIPDGAVMLGMTPDYEPVFICKPRLRYFTQDFHDFISLGIFIPSQNKCRSTYPFTHLNRLSFWDYEILWDPSYTLYEKRTRNRMFSCGSHGDNIELHLVCDGNSDCTDGKDEEIGLCRERSNCTSQQFPCSDGKCIPLRLTCQGRHRTNWNCLNGGDESQNTCPNNYECTELEFKCGDRNCIQKSLVCNGVTDCKDGSDENNTYCDEQLYGPKGFQCKSGKRLSYKTRCDGIFHCDDRSDEKACGMEDCKHTHSSKYSGQCKSDSYKLDKIQLKQGLWFTSPKNLSQHAEEYSFYSQFKEYTICRLVDTNNGSSRTILGALNYEHNEGRVRCVAMEILDAPTMEELPFQILHQDAFFGASWEENRIIWTREMSKRPNKKLRIEPWRQEDGFTDGVIIGGLTDGYEIYFVCLRWEKSIYECGSMRPRLQTCVRGGDGYYILHDTRYKK